jgi:hypothetical protein
MRAFILPLLVLLLPAGAFAASVSTAASTSADFSGIKQFPKDMWGAFKEQGRNEGLLTLVVAGGAASIARYGSRTYFDDFHLAETLNRRRPLGKRAVDFGSALGYPVYLFPVMGATYVAGTYLHASEAQEFGLLGFEALSLAGIQTAALKLAVNRVRPDHTDRAAFPSGHTSASFALATVAASKYGWGVGVPSIMLASFVGFTRMEGQSHYLSDVVFGAGLGIMSGRAVIQQRGKVHPERYTFAPFITPDGGGFTMAF